jgi:hypothetical protein
MSGQFHASSALTQGKIVPRTPWIGGWVDPKAGMDNEKKRKLFTLPELELRPLDRPIRSRSLYRMRKYSLVYGPKYSLKHLQSLSVRRNIFDEKYGEPVSMGSQ